MPKKVNFLHENHQDSPNLALLNVLNVLNVLDMPKASFPCWALFSFDTHFRFTPFLFFFHFRNLPPKDLSQFIMDEEQNP